MNTLTERQRQVARMVADGRTNREIANLLYVDESTVKNHLYAVAVKIGVPPGGSRRVHVARWVWEQENPRTDAEIEAIL